MVDAVASAGMGSQGQAQTDGDARKASELEGGGVQLFPSSAPS